MVVEADAEAPLISPSEGVTVHRTTSPRMNAPESVRDVPAATPSTVQAYDSVTESPSGSLAPEAVQVRVSDTVGDDGEIETDATIGGLLVTETGDEPDPVPP